MPLKASTEQKFRKIAEFEIFSRPEVYEVLPNSWGTLDQLRMQIEDEGEEAFLQTVQNEKVASDMTKQNAKFLYGKPESDDGDVYLKEMSDKIMKKLLKTDRLFNYRTQLVDELKRVDELLASQVKKAA